MNKEKQTILLIRNAAPRDFGGAETYPVSLASVLTNQGLSPIIVTRSKKLLHYAHEHAIPTVRGGGGHTRIGAANMPYCYPFILDGK